MYLNKLSFWLLLICGAACLWAGAACDTADDDDAAGPTPDDDDGAADDDDGPGDDDTWWNDDDNDTSPSPNDLVEEGKLWLHYGDGDRADLYFRQALETVPDHPEANYGVVIGRGLRILDVFSIIVDYVESFLDYGGPVKGDPDNLLDNLVEQFLSGFVYAPASEQYEFAQRCLDEGYTFHQEDSIPIIIHFELLAEMAGQFDEPELHAFLVQSLLLWGLLEHLDAISLDIDITYFFGLAELDFSGDLWGALGTTVDILLAAFTDPQFPDFFTLPEANVPQFQQAGLRLADGLNELLLTFEAIEYERGDQTDDVLGYVDKNHNGRFEDGEPYKMPGLDPFDDQAMDVVAALRYAAEEMRDSLWDDTEFDLNPQTRDPFHLSALNPLLAALDLPPLIPDWPMFTLDLGAMYAAPGHDEFKKTVITILRIADLIFELIPGD